MIKETRINKLLCELASAVNLPDKKNSDIDTIYSLHRLATNVNWGSEEIELVEFFSKRINISSKLFVSYNKNGRKSSEESISDPVLLAIAIAILYKVLFDNLDADIKKESALKRFNTLFKAMDLLDVDWLSPNTVLKNALDNAWLGLLSDLSECNTELEVTLPVVSTDKIRDDANFKVIPLTVMFYEGPIARAYLSTIKSLGLRPQKIIELVSAKDVVTKKNVGKWLPGGLRTTYAAIIQRNKIHYWPKWLLKTKSGFVNNIIDEVQVKFRFEKEVIDNANLLLPLSTYSDSVESLLVSDLNDLKLHQYLINEPEGAILFTGGGIVPTTLLAIKHLKLLHIHPGYLPKIRGADCVLWSSLLTGHTSATCFYMSPGIDTGDIIFPCWLPKLSFKTEVQGIDEKAKYRAVYSFVDPWVRAYVLRKILYKSYEYYSLDSVQQFEEDGVTFHFMHKMLHRVAFEKLFNI